VTGVSGKKLIWATLLFMDIELSRTTQIEVLRSLAKQGYDVTLVAAYSKMKPSFEEMEIQGFMIPSRKVPVLSFAFLSLILTVFLPVLILKSKPRFLIVEPHYGTFLGLISARGVPRPIRPKIIVDIRSTPIETRGLRGLFESVLFHMSLIVAREMLDGITVITGMMRDDICARYHIDPKSVGVWTSGVSPEIFAPNALRAKKLRAELGLEGKFAVIYHGVLTANRGVAEAIRSMRLLNGKYREVVLFVLGKGPALPFLKKVAQQEILEGRVIFHEAVDYHEVPQYISACDIGIVPYPDVPDWRYCCALGLLECLAMEKVVVATDIPSNRAVSAGSKCVIYAGSTDADGIARAIMNAFDNREMLAKWGASGRAVVKERYAWAIVARDLDRYLSARVPRC
jgi:glycosyltransferase involved in cell wall biosynthesis